MLPTMIREKQLLIAIRLQELGELRQQRDAGERELTARRAELERWRAQMESQLAAGQDLEVQQLQFARMQMAVLERHIREMDEALRQQDSVIDELEVQLGATRREREKLQTVFEERRQVERNLDQQREWLLLDEWVLNRGSKRA